MPHATAFTACSTSARDRGCSIYLAPLLQVTLPVSVIQEARQPVIALLHHMLWHPREIESRTPGHASSIPHPAPPPPSAKAAPSLHPNAPRHVRNCPWHLCFSTFVSCVRPCGRPEKPPRLRENEPGLVPLSKLTGFPVDPIVVCTHEL
jgi:hypothetical protein